MPTSSITVTLKALGGWGLRCVPGSSFLHLLTPPTTTPRPMHRAGRAAASHICTTPPERALRDPTQPRLARCSCHPPCSRAGGGCRSLSSREDPREILEPQAAQAASSRHRAPGALRQALPLGMTWLQPSQLTEGLVLVTYSIPPCSQAQGSGWGGKERRKDRLPLTLTPLLCRHLFLRRNSTLAQKGSPWENCFPFSMGKNRQLKSRGNSRIL